MSGMYQHRFGFEFNSGPERFASQKFGLPRSVPSLAEKLKAAGYATGRVGKWPGRQHAARVGDWKLVVVPGASPMLFNLKDDIGEERDVAKERPEKLKELQAAYAAWGAKMMPARWIRQDRSNAAPGGKLKPRTGR